jgi:glutathione S-transferase
MQQASYHIARTFGSSFNHTDIEQPVPYTHGIRSWLIETRISGDQQLMTGRLHQPTPSAVSTFCVPRQQRAMDRLCARECGVHGHRRLSGDQSARGHRRNVMARAHWQLDRACPRFCKRPYSHIRDAGEGRLFAVVRNAAFPLRRNVGDPRRRDRFMSTYELGVGSPYVKHGIAAYERAFKMLEDTLAETGPWILGANPSLADINLMPLAARLDYLGLLDLWIKDRPRVKSWWAQAHEWPSFKSGLRDLISEAEFSEMTTHGPKIANEVAAIIADVRRNTPAAVT